MSTAGGVRVEEVEYLRIDGEPYPATAYLPAGSGPFPGLLDVHGGAWVGGDRFNNVALDEALAARGIAVVAVEFRKPPAARYPGPIADVNFAIRWLKANGARFGIPPELVCGLGSSSGGHQLMLATMRHDDPRYLAHELPGGPDATLRCAVLCWAVTDPVARLAMARALGIERFIEAHAAYWPDEEAMSEGSPQAILERKEPVELPPALVIQGTEDENLTPDMADRFAAAYRGSGGALRLEKFEGEPHMFVTLDPTSAASQRAISTIADFLLERASAPDPRPALPSPGRVGG